jgi:hypothetical protein
MVFSPFLWFFLFFFPELSLSILFVSYWTGWEFSFVVFFSKTLWIATVFPYIVFFLDLSLSILFFSYWAGWEFSFTFFFYKTLWIATVLPHMIFFCYDFFSKLSLLILLFLILSWLRITTVDFLMKHYRLLQCFSAWFFFPFIFFCYYCFQNFLCWFIF